MLCLVVHCGRMLDVCVPAVGFVSHSGIIASHMLHGCKTAGTTFLVSTNVPDPTSSRHCSEQGHIQGAKLLGMEDIFSSWPALLKSNPPELEAHTLIY